MVRLKLDVLVAANAAALGALRRATTTIPIVMENYGGDPVADGIVTSFARPGGNITGVTPLDPELSGKQICSCVDAAWRSARNWNPRVKRL
jgi:putative ABC transport system substrate-binding protein